MAVGVPGNLNFGVPKPPRNLLDVNSFVRQQGSVGVPEVVDAYPRQTGFFCKKTVFVVQAGVPQALRPAANPLVLCESIRLLLPCFVLVQQDGQRLRYLQVTIRGFILGRRFHIATF